MVINREEWEEMIKIAETEKQQSYKTFVVMEANLKFFKKQLSKLPPRVVEDSKGKVCGKK